VVAVVVKDLKVNLAVRELAEAVVLDGITVLVMAVLVGLALLLSNTLDLRRNIKWHYKNKAKLITLKLMVMALSW
jgi:hypothetical protein